MFVRAVGSAGKQRSKRLSLNVIEDSYPTAPYGSICIPSSLVRHNVAWCVTAFLPYRAALNKEGREAPGMLSVGQRMLVF